MTNTVRAELVQTEDSITRYFSKNSVKGVDMVQLLRRFGSGSGCFDSLNNYTAHIPLLVKDLEFQMPSEDYIIENDSIEEDENLKQFAITVHGIKWASYGIAAQEVGRAAEDIENAAREGNCEFIKCKTPDFIFYMDRFISDLEDFLEQADEFNELSWK
jgi:hypothetical protein